LEETCLECECRGGIVIRLRRCQPLLPCLRLGVSPASLFVAACEQNTIEGQKTHHQTELTYCLLFGICIYTDWATHGLDYLRPCAITALFTYPNMTASKGKSSSTDPPSPSASFYDLSDDEEGEYNTIAHSKVGKGVKLLFSKSKVRCSAAASPA
jgi:hypothetical protein